MANFLPCSLFLLLTEIFAYKSVTETFDENYRISNGNLTNIRRYPSLVQVDFFFEDKGIWDQNCAANILTELHALSAAHCFIGPGYQTSHRRIRAGTTERNIGGIIVYIRNEFMHPNFRKFGFDGDLAIVLLANRLRFSPEIKPVNIVGPGSVIPDNRVVRVAGWGATSQHGRPSHTLLDATIFTINNGLCARRYRMLPRPLFVTEKMICAGMLSMDDHRDVCPGDSGGGLFYGDLMVGIVSWSNGCDKPHLPAVYTDVSYYTDWILSIVLQNIII